MHLPFKTNDMEEKTQKVVPVIDLCFFKCLDGIAFLSKLALLSFDMGNERNGKSFAPYTSSGRTQQFLHQHCRVKAILLHYQICLQFGKGPTSPLHLFVFLHSLSYAQFGIQWKYLLLFLSQEVLENIDMNLSPFLSSLPLSSLSFNRGITFPKHPFFH